MFRKLLDNVANRYSGYSTSNIIPNLQRYGKAIVKVGAVLATPIASAVELCKIPFRHDDKNYAITALRMSKNDPVCGDYQDAVNDNNCGIKANSSYVGIYHILDNTFVQCRKNLLAVSAGENVNSLDPNALHCLQDKTTDICEANARQFWSVVSYMALAGCLACSACLCVAMVCKLCCSPSRSGDRERLVSNQAQEEGSEQREGVSSYGSAPSPVEDIELDKQYVRESYAAGPGR